MWATTPFPDTSRVVGLMPSLAPHDRRGASARNDARTRPPDAANVERRRVRATDDGAACQLRAPAAASILNDGWWDLLLWSM